MPQPSTLNDIADGADSCPIAVESMTDGGEAATSKVSPPKSGLGTLLSRLPMAVIWALGAQAILSITRLLTSMTVGGRFGSGSEEQLGYYSSAFGVLMLLVGLHEAFVTTPLTVFNQNRANSQRKQFSGSMLITSVLVIGLIAAITGVLIALQAGFQILKPELGAALVAAAALAPLQLLREFSRRWLLANLQVVASAWLECFFAACYLVALIGLVYAANVSAISVFVTIGCVNAIGLLVWWMIYRSEFQFASKSTTMQVSENFRYGRWVAGENVCSVLTMYLCIWVLTFSVDEAAAGVFFACFTVVLLANPFLLGIASILAPKAAQAFVQNGWAGMRRVLLQYGTLVVGVLACFSAFLFVFGDDLTDLFFGPKYADYFAAHFDGVNHITATLGIAMPFLGLSFVLTSGLLAANRPYESFYSAIVGLAILVAANFSFSERTLATAAVSFVISIAGMTLCRLFFLVRAYRIHAGPQSPIESPST
jgi:O-antigen/teichoic acid export membrane protein